MTRFFALLLFSLISVLSVDAQTKSEYGTGNAAKKLNEVNFGMSYGHDWGHSISDTYLTRISYEFFKKPKISLLANVRYTLTEASFDSNTILSDYSPNTMNMNGFHNTGQLGLTASFKTRIFGKPIVGAAIINSDWGAGGFARVSGMFMSMIMLRADKNTQFGLGPLFLVNTNGNIPAIVAFMYRHRFDDKWMLNLSGGMFAMEYTPTEKDKIGMGFDINIKSFYFKPEVDDLPKKLKYTAVSFRPMIKYTRRIIGDLHFDIEHGTSINIVDRVNGMTGTKKYLKCNNKAVFPFLQLSASYAL